MKLFEVGKVGMVLDQVAHGVEQRQGDEVKIVKVTLRIQPFDHVLATALQQAVRATLFKLNHPNPQPHIKRVDFTLGVPRQQLVVFAAPDTVAPSITFDQVKIDGTYARTQKDVNGFAFIIKGSFGPVDKTELEYLQDWLLGQRFVTCEPAEPGLFDDDDDFEPDDAVPSRPAPMFDDEEAPTR